MKTFRYAVLTITGILLAAHLVFAALNSQALTSVTIQLLPDLEEHQDKTFLTIGRKEVLPDYEVVIHGDESSRWNLGFKKDVSAKEPLTFPVADPIPLRYVQTIVVQDKDNFETDVLDTAPLDGMEFATSRFQYTIETKPTFGSFLWYFFDTPLGIAISTGIMIGIVAFIILLLFFCEVNIVDSIP